MKTIEDLKDLPKEPTVAEFLRWLLGVTPKPDETGNVPDEK